MLKIIPIPENLKESYESHLKSESFNITRFFALLTLGFSITSIFVDIWAIPSTLFEANVVRGMLITLEVFVLWAIYRPKLNRYFAHFQHILSLGPALGVIAILHLSNPDDTGHYIYVGYLIIIIMLFFSWSTLTLKALILNTVTILLSYSFSVWEGVVFDGNDLQKCLECYIPSVFLMIGAAITGFVGKTINENNLRQNFLSRQTLKESLKTQHYYANHDELTGLFNRHAASRFFDEDLNYAKEHNATHFVMLLDLNKFKKINDIHGHNAGDTVLKITAKRLKNCLRECDSISRIGGDEFAISVVLKKDEKDSINEISNKIQQRVIQPISIGDVEVSVGTSVGVASYPSDGDDCEVLLKIADERMYENKRKQGSSHKVNTVNESLINSVVVAPLGSIPV